MVFSVASPLLDGCVLALIDQGDTYGYALTQGIQQWLEISESTLYPILRRLQQQGALQTYDKPFQGRNRRYYAITPVGRTQLERRREEWRQFRDGVEELLKEEEDDGQTDLLS